MINLLILCLCISWTILYSFGGLHHNVEKRKIQIQISDTTNITISIDESRLDDMKNIHYYRHLVSVM